MTDRSISDEQLNAFVDNQLNQDEKDQILASLQQDEDLSRRACETRRLTELVQHAYSLPPTAPSEQKSHGLSRLGQAVAACLLVVLGATAGWLGNDRLHQDPIAQIDAMYLDDEKAFQNASLDQAPTTITGERKILLHLSSADPQKLKAALDMTEQMLNAYRARHVPVKLELVANAGGLNLLRKDTTPFAQRIEDLYMEYDELTFYACHTAMSRLMAREGMDTPPALMPEAQTTANALEQILSRLQQGWVYVSV